ncbi:MAG: hypothetical protein M0Q91_14490 [Methanoregula sp.]|jgi:hypothetical protein|nr:hypothetical protein [Methanoregula sp.]
MSDGKFDTEGYRVCNPHECEFEDTLNNLQICLTEIRRDILKSRDRLNKISPDGSMPDDYDAAGVFVLESAFLRVCKSWEDKLSKDLENRMKGQAVLSV